MRSIRGFSDRLHCCDDAAVGGYTSSVACGATFPSRGRLEGKVRKAFRKAKRNPNLVFCAANVGDNRQNKFELIRTANLALEGEGSEGGA
jgi:hypothetical protein